MLAEAVAIRLCEADPAADVDGLDAADKIAILSALAFGGTVDRDALPTTGISALQGRDVDTPDSSATASSCWPLLSALHR